jgi:hypothetical protein
VRFLLPECGVALETLASGGFFMTRILWLISFIFAVVFSSTAFAYFGYHSSEARLSFDAFAEVTTDQRPSPDDALKIVAKHYDFLFGDLAINDTMGGPKNDGHATINKIEPIKHGFRVSYSFEGTVVLQSGPRTHLTVELPNNAHEMFLKTKAAARVNPCTDPDYLEEAEFSYFWSPHRPGCKKVIKEGVDYQVIDASLERISNTEHTRPDYERLADENGEVHISLLMGPNDSGSSLNPMESEGTKLDDLNAINFRKIRKRLMKDGFASPGAWSHEKIREVVEKDVRPLPYVEDLSQEYNGTRVKKVTVTMFFGLTDMTDDSWAFDYFYKRAIEKSALIIFDGHTGMGTNLTIPILEEKLRAPFKVQADRYQILYANSCSSYGYYNLDFFKRKARKNLNVITAGLETPFDGGVGTDMAMMEAVHKWAAQGTMIGFRTLMSRLESDNLAGVNGDEDNPTTMD